MLLRELLAGKALPVKAAELSIRGLTADSRQVEPGFLFAALDGAKTSGARFMGDATARGAAAILAGEGADDIAAVPVIRDENPRRALALAAARFYARQPRSIVAVTGTNGKTSTTHFVRQIWSALGVPAVSLGTLGAIGADGHRIDEGAPLTTPDPVALHRLLDRLAGEGIAHVAMEASSHGLDQFRLDGVEVRAAAFTNLTRDHLDYHGTEEAYLAAKLRLFKEVLKPDGTAIVNADAPYAEDFAAAARGRGLRLVTVGETGEDLRLLGRTATRSGQTLRLLWRGRIFEVALPLIGAFQAMNALIAAALAEAEGASIDALVAALARLETVPGRMEHVGEVNGASVYVDYAHTPDALEVVLGAIRPHTSSRLHVVFGCGGDRDAGKRPLMGAAAARLADLVIVTDDNPRSEAPALIRQAVLAAAKGTHVREIGDRREAIHTAIAALKPGDILLIAGKGHESGQIVKDTVLPFSDRDVALEAIAHLSGDGA